MSADATAGVPGMPARIAEYRLLSQIGRSRLAAVYLAQDERAGRSVAFKVLIPPLGRDGSFRTRFMRESEAAADVGHPGILPVYEVGAVGECLFVAMAYVPGGDAGSLVESGGRFPAAQVWSIVAQVASALDAAHDRGLVHGDVKPANILLERGADVGQVYLSDFGMGAAPADARLPVAPSYEYMAPEQAAGYEADGHSDLYSLACAGYALLCGAPPFGHEQGAAGRYAQMYAHPPMATAVRPDLPAAVDLVLATALSKSPAERYPTCTKFAEALRIALGVSTLAADPPPPRTRHSGGFSRPSPSAVAVPPGPAGGPPDARPPALADLPPRGGREVPARRPAQGPPGRAVVQGRPPWELPGAPADAPWPPPEAAREDSFPEFARFYGEPRKPRPEPERPFPGDSFPGDSFPEDPGHTGWQQDPAYAHAGPTRQPVRSARPRKLVLAAAVVIVVAAGVFVGVEVSGNHGSSSGTSPTAASSPRGSSSASAAPSGQATAVGSLLSSSLSTRKAMSGLVGDVLACTNVPAAVSQMQGVVGQRSTEASQASALSTSALPNGAAVKSSLVAAMRASLTADQDYLAWAQQQSSGCQPGAQTDAYKTALQADTQAANAKDAFVQVWNPVATRYGLPQQNDNSF